MVARFAASFAFGIVVAFGADIASAQAPRTEGDDYQQSVAPATPTQIIQQKAQAKGAERAARIAAQQWYGYSQSRPRTTATPFSGLYGAQFNGRAYGRPAAHYPHRPVIVVTR